MSKIEKELAKACDIDVSKYGPKERQALLADIVKVVNKFNDKEWDGLSIPAQDWFNAAAEVAKQKKNDPDVNLPDFPDAEPPQEETRSRRRSSSDDEDKKPAKGESMAVEKLQEGDRVKLTTKRGKEISGEVVEQSKRKEFVVVKTAKGDEEEVDWDKVDSVEVFHGDAGKQEDAGPEVGDEVEFTTTRGKKVGGVITELDEKTIVLDKTDDYDMSRIDGDIKIVKKGGGAKGKGKDDDEQPRGRGRASSDDDGGSSSGGRSRGGSRTTEDGKEEKVSVGGRIRELLAEDPDRSKESIAAVLKKEKIEYRDTSLNLIYREGNHFIKLLRAAKHMK